MVDVEVVVVDVGGKNAKGDDVSEAVVVVVVIGVFGVVVVVVVSRFSFAFLF